MMAISNSYEYFSQDMLAGVYTRVQRVERRQRREMLLQRKKASAMNELRKELRTESRRK